MNLRDKNIQLASHLGTGLLGLKLAGDYVAPVIKSGALNGPAIGTAIGIGLTTFAIADLVVLGVTGQLKKKINNN